MRPKATGAIDPSTADLAGMIQAHELQLATVSVEPAARPRIEGPGLWLDAGRDSDWDLDAWLDAREAETG